MFSILDLLTCRELLGIRLGPHFLHTASTNKDQYVSAQVCKELRPSNYVFSDFMLASKVVQALSAPPISTADMHTYLTGIARSYNVQWVPEYRPSDV